MVRLDNKHKQVKEQREIQASAPQQIINFDSSDEKIKILSEKIKMLTQKLHDRNVLPEIDKLEVQNGI